MSLSPYATGAPALTALGYTCIPLAPANCELPARGKTPARMGSGGWYPMPKWQAFRDRQPSPFEVKGWSAWADTNIGVVMGTSVRAGYVLGSVDIDATDPDEFDAILRACPSSPMAKKGAKGLTLFYAMPEAIKSKPYAIHWLEDGKKKQRTLVDLLTGNQTRQTVCPPSIHPDGPEYVWLAGPVAVKELPVFGEDELTVLEETLESLGWGAESSASSSTPASPAPTTSTVLVKSGDHEETIWSDLNAKALAEMSKWVPDLDLYNLRSKQGGGYEAVATWRDSNTGRPLTERKRNLQIHPTGIRDFGDRSYSAQDLVMAARGVSQSEAFIWLSEKLGMLEPLPMLVERDDGTIEVEGVAIEPAADPDFPDELTRPAGLVGDIVDYIEATSQFPQRALALGVALCIVGTAAGRKYAGPTISGTHLYVFALAPTGTGKNHAPKMADRIMVAAGMEHMIGPSEFISGPAVVQNVARRPCMLSFIDEFGVVMGRINGNKASGYERQISGLLRTYWGKSFETVRPIAYADSNAAANTKPIHAPALSIYGMSVPEEFYEALQGADVFNGFLNRFLIIATNREPREVEPTSNQFEIPESISQRLREIHTCGGAAYETSMHNGEVTKPLVSVPWSCVGAKDAYTAFKKQTDNDKVNGNMLKRSAEMALRMATILAVGQNSDAPRITLANMAWGIEVARWSATRMIADANSYMVESDHQGRVKLLLRMIKDAPGGRISRRELTRKVNHRFDTRTMDMAVQGLKDSGEIIEAEIGRDGPGRRTTELVYTGG